MSILQTIKNKLKSVFKKRKSKSSGYSGLKNFSREQCLCIAVTVLLAGAGIIADSGASGLLNGNTLKRSAPGEAERSYELTVGGISDSGEKISVRVSEREYTQEEAKEMFSSLMEELSLHIVGKNRSLDRITADMVFPKRVDGFGGIRLSFYPTKPELVSYDGSVNNLELGSPVNTDIRVVLKAGKYTEEYSVPITVYPAELNTAELISEKLKTMIERADTDQITEEELVLPEEVAGHHISYAGRKNKSWLKILAGGIFAVVLLGLKPEQDRRRREKERENELLLDYSEVVSKIMVYMGAGLAVKNAWIRIAQDYERNLKSGQLDRRAVYEEMLITAGELERGVSETRAYSDFAKRCPQQCYMKLVSLLEQERKNGDARIRDAMELEVRQSFEQRKNIARRLGEEAGTKLMAPLMLSLITVLLIVAIPAMMTLT